MARPALNYTLSQLEKLLDTRRTQLDTLTRRRDKIQKRLDGLNAKIAAIGGAPAGGGGGRGRGGRRGKRARNDISLQDLIHQILSKAGGAVRVGDIADKALAAGYHSNSVNFRGIVNQMLIKDKRFVAADRGLYQLKK